MKLSHEYHQHDLSLYIAGNGIADEDGVNLIHVSSNGDATFSLTTSLDGLVKLRRFIDSVLEEEEGKMRCPACGYTQNEAFCNGDHRICREYPYFPFEMAKQPESEAVNR